MPPHIMVHLNNRLSSSYFIEIFLIVIFFFLPLYKYFIFVDYVTYSLTLLMMGVKLISNVVQLYTACSNYPSVYLLL